MSSSTRIRRYRTICLPEQSWDSRIISKISLRRFKAKCSSTMSFATTREQGRGRPSPTPIPLRRMRSSCSSRSGTSNARQVRDQGNRSIIFDATRILLGCRDGDMPAVGLFLVLMVVVAGCSSSAKLVGELENGGMITYPYLEEQDVLASPNRQGALRLMETKCPGGYRISREGQIAQISPVVVRTWKGQISSNGQVSREKQWAIQFSCK